jgi:ribonuclease Y
VHGAQEEIEQRIVRSGEEAVLELGIHGVHRELVKLLGALKFRTIDGQNLLEHSLETAEIAGMLAAELGYDEKLARRVGLLHCVGYAVEHSVEGDHAKVGSEVARRHGEKKNVTQAILHYRDENPRDLVTVLLQVASKLSASRPGARQEKLDQYLRRLDDLEELCTSFAGVERAWAMMAGTEVRVVANYASITDDEAMVLAGDIAERIEKELTYPGEVRVTVLREARATEIAH